MECEYLVCAAQKSSIDGSMCSRCDFLIFLIYTFRLSLLPGREATGAGSVRSAVGSYTLKRYWAGLEIKQHTFSMSAAASPDCNLNTYCFNLVSCHKAISPSAVTGSAIVLRQHRNLRKGDLTNFVMHTCTKTQHLWRCPPASICYSLGDPLDLRPLRD